LQGKLLTALESKRVRRLGAVTERVVDVKIIAATNADLAACVSAGRLRADLYHRLAVVILTLPPIRQRGEDVVLLAQTFLQQLGSSHGVPPNPWNPTPRGGCRSMPGQGIFGSCIMSSNG